jgi:hypothetical protein
LPCSATDTGRGFGIHLFNYLIEQGFIRALFTQPCGEEGAFSEVRLDVRLVGHYQVEPTRQRQTRRDVRTQNYGPLVER